LILFLFQFREGDMDSSDGEDSGDFVLVQSHMHEPPTVDDLMEDDTQSNLSEYELQLDLPAARSPSATAGRMLQDDDFEADVHDFGYIT
jgi:hypothetical protein